jgi:hypothetical protein
VINQRLVTDGVLAALRATGNAIGDNTAPAGAGQVYAVLEADYGAPEGGLEPELGCWLTYRVRCVGVDRATAAGHTNPRMDAEQLAHVLRSRLLDRSQPIAGTGWSVGGRIWESSATDREGPTVNVIDDFRVLVSAA